MIIYSLTPLGYQLSHSTRNQNTDEWRIVHYLARNHTATKDKMENDLGVSPITLAKLSRKGVITERTGVGI